MSNNFSRLQEATENYFQGIATERRRAVGILRAIYERCLAREVPASNIWFKRDNPAEGQDRHKTAETVLEGFPHQGMWKTLLVIRVRAEEQRSYTEFSNEVSIRFDPPTGTAHLFLGDDEIAQVNPDSSPTNQEQLAKFTDALFDGMIASFKSPDDSRRRIGFLQ